MQRVMQYADEKGWSLSESMRQKHDVIFYVALNCDCIEFPVEWLLSVSPSFVALANFFEMQFGRFYCTYTQRVRNTQLFRHSYSIYCSRIKAEIATKMWRGAKRMLGVLEPNADVIFIFGYESDVCVQHFLTVQWAHCQAYIYGDTVIKLKQEHVAVSQNKWQKNYRMRIKIRIPIWCVVILGLPIESDR